MFFIFKWNRRKLARPGMGISFCFFPSRQMKSNEPFGIYKYSTYKILCYSGTRKNTWQVLKGFFEVCPPSGEYPSAVLVTKQFEKKQNPLFQLEQLWPIVRCRSPGQTWHPITFTKSRGTLAALLRGDMRTLWPGWQPPALRFSAR